MWNSLDGRVCFDAADLSYWAEDAVIRRAATLFADLDAVVEVRDDARVHVWQVERFGLPARPFTSTYEAIDHFASTVCCFGVARTAIRRAEAVVVQEPTHLLVEGQRRAMITRCGAGRSWTAVLHRRR